MKYFVLPLTILFLLFCNLSFAQTQSGFRLGFGIDGGIATKDPFKSVLGGDIRLQKDLSDHLSATLTAGFTHFFEKDHFDGYNQYGSPYNVIPVKAGLKYFVTDNFYVGAEAGVGFGFEQWGNSFLYSPSLGVAFKNGLDVSVKYEDYTRSTITKDIALRLAYGVDLSNHHATHKRIERAEGWQLGFEIDPGIAGSNDDFALGGQVNLYRHLTNNLEAIASTGVTHFSVSCRFYNFNTYTYMKTSGETIIPVMAGLRLYAGNQFYVAGEAGAAFSTHGNASFAYSPSLGLAFSNGLDLGVKYENFSDNYPELIALKLGYRFKL
jgi:hypothetical protein